MHDTPKKQSWFKPVHVLWVLALPVLFYVLFVGWRGWISTNLYDQSRQTIALYVTGLNELLSKYEPLPRIYALHPDIQALLDVPDDKDLRHRANTLLKQYNTVSEASDTYVLDHTGLTLAASNWDQSVTFVGRSFSYRPYFTDAMAGGSGRFFALGTTSLQRGYYLSNAIVDDHGNKRGVVVVKIDVAQAETGWQAQDHEVIVTDHAGVVFLSSKPDWLYKSIGTPSETALKDLAETRRYADRIIAPLPFKTVSDSPPWTKSFRPTDRRTARYLATHHDLPRADWRIWLLADTSSIHNTAQFYSAASVLVIAMFAVALFSLIERRRGLLQALDVQQRARRTLEDSANELKRQVEKRTKDLRRTQNELLQAAKMAALGQMSVGINHELNQPLTAIRSYASNAAKFLDKGRTDEARDNLSLISSLSERMGDIILRLKIFARPAPEERSPIVIQSAINDCLRIVSPRLKKDKVTLNIDIPSGDIVVMADNVRLEQVLVNLINNAADAQDHTPSPTVTVTLMSDWENAIVRVSDNGPGIPEDIIDHLFEPFVTSKDVGLGLGLGLSISHGIIQEFGGELTAHNLEQGGAEFTFTIPLTDRPEVEAET
ncbi:ATP-binding protein [Magnetovibrio sp. PR-2]|uniref:sensor histidine kinase n=1 Tax=Magnetovibrio sp. PR-2 TaxID=3120356 RepID=UPI002FCDFA6C